MTRPLAPETINRNWNELLQELRVVQTGIQILTGFLLTVPFSSRFVELSDRDVTVYLLVLSGSVLTTALVISPVAFHRMLFRRRKRQWLVEAAHIAARVGLASMALTSAGVLFLVFDVVVGPTAGIIAMVVAALFFAATWAALPWWSHR